MAEVVVAEIGGRDVYLLFLWLVYNFAKYGCMITYERALVFLLLRLSLLTRFFLHLALILSADYE